MERISEHVSWGEATKSQTATRKGIDNTPTEFQLKNMQMVAENCFEPLRNSYGKPIYVSSFMRSKALNEAIGGSTTSQHMQGFYTQRKEGAMDIDADVFDNGITNAEIFHWLDKHVEYDQLIWEYGDEENCNWVHVSYRQGANRRMKLRAYRDENNNTKYDVI